MSDIFVSIDKNQSKSVEDWRTYTLILGCVSTANVPQLTIDLIISTLKQRTNDCNVCGYLYSDALMPLSGPDPYTFGGQQLATSCQVFSCESRKLVLVLQRSPIFKELRDKFYDQLSKWISKHSFARIITLSSSFIEHLESAPALRETYPLRYMTENGSADEQYMRQILNWKAVEKVDKYTLQPSLDGVIHLPGSGALKPLMARFKKLNISPVVALILYCSEGDNRPHAYAFADMINAWLNLVDNVNNGNNTVSAGDNSVWVEPYSWRNFFGDEAPKNIY